MKTAFLQGENLKRNVFLVPPVEANARGFVWKLKKCVYGLVDGRRCSYGLKAMLFVVSKFDPALFVHNSKNGSINRLIGAHVDDFWYSVTPFFKENVVIQLRNVFIIGTETHLLCVIWEYLPLSMTENPRLIWESF